MATKEEVMEYVEKCAQTRKFIKVKAALLTIRPYGYIAKYHKLSGTFVVSIKTIYGPIDLNLTWEDVIYE